MIEVDVYKLDGTPSGEKVQLDERIFNVKVHEHLIYLAVKATLANRRSGTHKTRERSEVHGSTRKLRPQKGFGRARVGSITNPIFRHGGTIFGPRPRDYSQKMNKKASLLARLSALSYIYQNQKMKVVEDIILEEPKTKYIAQFLKNFNIHWQEGKVLLVSPISETLKLSARNIPAISLCDPSSVNTYDILRVREVLFTKTGILELQKELLALIEKRGLKPEMATSQ